MKHLLFYLLLLFLAICSAQVSIADTTTLTGRILATATAPTPSATAAAPPGNLTTAMLKKGCKAFATLLSSIPDVISTFDSVVAGGLTVFCPTDRSLATFMPTYKNLTADGKASLLLYHGVPIYNSRAMLKTSNGEFNTLATDGTTRNFNFTVQNAGDAVTLKSGIVTATITATVLDKQPLAIYAVDTVLQPRELFKVVEAPAPAPAPVEKAADATSAPAPAGPEESPADQNLESDTSAGAAAVASGGRWVVVAIAAVGMVTWSTWIRF